MARRNGSHAATFPSELRNEFFFNSRWLDLGREVWPDAPAKLKLPLHMHVVDEGDGEPVVCVHGNPTWSFMWRHVIRGLSDTHRVVAADHIGMGWSDKPRAFRYRLADHIAALTAVIEQLRLKRINLVVHDWGGIIGLGYAIRHPENVRRLVITNTAAFRATSLPWQIALARTPLLGALLVRGLNLFARGALSACTAKPGSLLGTPAGRGLVWPYRSWSTRIGVHRFVQDIPLRPSHPSWPTLLEIESGLARLAATPTLLAWGLRDFVFTPAFLARFRELMPNARTLELPDAGHYLFEDAHDRLVPAIRDFLAAT